MPSGDALKESGRRSALVDGRHASVTQGSGEVVVGFASGQLRHTVTVGAFTISKHPVTRGEYRACVDAGACSTPGEDACYQTSPSPVGGPNFASKAADDVPVTCVGTEAAQKYCARAGGALPKLHQWMLAARGAQPQRYSWGDTEPDCSKHVFGAADTEGVECPGGDEQANFAIAKRGAGASPSGVQDVLLTPGELIAPDPEALFAACGTTYRGCVVRGLGPAAIDSVQPVITNDAGAEKDRSPYGFRCVWQGSEE